METINLYAQYLKVLQENPELRIYYKGKEVYHFKEIPDKPKEIFINFNKKSPMSGYGGRISWMRFWGKIKYVKKEYRVKCYMVEDSDPSDKYFNSFPTLEKALKYVIPDFRGLLSYYSEYSYTK